MTNEQSKEMLSLLAEILIEQRRGNDRTESLEHRMESIERRLDYYADTTKMILKNHESRIRLMEHE